MFLLPNPRNEYGCDHRWSWEGNLITGIPEMLPAMVLNQLYSVPIKF